MWGCVKEIQATMWIAPKFANQSGSRRMSKSESCTKNIYEGEDSDATGLPEIRLVGDLAVRGFCGFCASKKSGFHTKCERMRKTAYCQHIGYDLNVNGSYRLKTFQLYVRNA